jgi:hypothetical protein
MRHTVMLQVHGPSCFVTINNYVNLVNSTSYLFSYYFYALNMSTNFLEQCRLQLAKRHPKIHEHSSFLVQTSVKIRYRNCSWDAHIQTRVETFLSINFKKLGYFFIFTTLNFNAGTYVSTEILDNVFLRLKLADNKTCNVGITFVQPLLQ